MSFALTKTFMNPAKTLHYNQDGNGRDTYIHTFNGGFYPSRKTNGVEEIGKLSLPSDSPFLMHRYICNREATGKNFSGQHSF